MRFKNGQDAIIRNLITSLSRYINIQIYTPEKGPLRSIAVRAKLQADKIPKNLPLVFKRGVGYNFECSLQLRGFI